MKVTGKVSVYINLSDFVYPDEAYATIRAEIGEVSPARMLSEYMYRLLSQMDLPGTITQVSAIPEQWTEEQA
jgi:hypothetical protein